MYVAVKGGERAIDERPSLARRAERRGDPAVPELGVAQIRAAARPRGRPGDERGLAATTAELAALAIKQARAIWSRPPSCCAPIAPPCRASATASRSTPARMAIAAADLGDLQGPAGRPGAGARPSTTPTACSISRCWRTARSAGAGARPKRRARPMPQALVDMLDREGLIQAGADDDARRPSRRDLTREPLLFPAERDAAPAEPRARRRGLPAGSRLLDPARLRRHATRSSARSGSARSRSSWCPRSSASRSRSARSTVTECQMVNQFEGSHDQPPQFTRGYGLAFGHAERRAMSMALVDRALRAARDGRGGARARRRTRSSCSITRTTCRRRASSSI